MGMCDPKAVRAGTPWYKAVNQPGFMRVGTQENAKKPVAAGHLPGKVNGTLQTPKAVSHNKSSQFD